MFGEVKVIIPDAVFALLILTRILSMLCEFSFVDLNVSVKFTVPEVLSNTPDGKNSRLAQLSQVSRHVSGRSTVNLREARKITALLPGP